MLRLEPVSGGDSQFAGSGRQIERRADNADGAAMEMEPNGGPVSG